MARFRRVDLIVAGSRGVYLTTATLMNLILLPAVLHNHGEAAAAAFAMITSLAPLTAVIEGGSGASITTRAAEWHGLPSASTAAGLSRAIRSSWLTNAVVGPVVAAVVLVSFICAGIARHYSPVLPQFALLVIAVVTLLTVAAAQTAAFKVAYGIGRSHLVFVVQAAVTLCMLPLLASLAFVAPLWILILAYPVAPILTGAIVFRLLRPVWRIDRALGAYKYADWRSDLSLAGPMWLISVALVLSFALDRPVIAVAAAPREVVTYSFAAMAVSGCLSIVQSFASGLWGEYVLLRRDGGRNNTALVRAWKRDSRHYLLIGINLGALTALGVLVIYHVLALSSRSPVLVACSAGALVACQATQLPLGMANNDARGLRFQVWTTLLMSAANLPLSFVLAQRFGAAGPLVASVLTLVVLHYLPNYWYLRRPSLANVLAS